VVASLNDQRSYSTSGPVSTWMGDRLQVGKPSWYNQPPRSTQPFILPGSINEYRQHAGGKGVRITSVGWQVTLCDPR